MQQHPARTGGGDMETMGKILHFRSRIEQQQEANAMKETDYVKACTGNGKANDTNGIISHANDEKGQRFLDTMPTTPTPGVVRAAQTLWFKNVSLSVQDIARVIDKETHVPELLAALRGLVAEVKLHKLNVKRDFSLINAHAYATKIIHAATGLE